MIQDDVIEQIRCAVKIDEVIGEFLVFKKKGSQLWANCPFHLENTPSFAVSPSKGFFKCFGCDVKGDSISFLMQYEKMTFVEAIHFLGKKYNIHVKEEFIGDNNLKTEKDNLFAIYEAANKYFIDNLYKKQGMEYCIPYLKQRNINDESIKIFNLGYSLDKWDDLLFYLKKHGFDDTEIQKSGLVVVKDTEQNDKKTYDLYRKRLIFPIHNTYGKVIAFGARIICNNKDQRSPKYINSPETPVYTKSDVLYGIFQAKNFIKKHKNCYLVEGYTDVISLYQNGIKNVVASGGTSFTKKQVALISRFCKQVTIIFDGDSAGTAACFKGIDLILKQGLDVKIVALPLGQDPDSFASNTTKDLSAYIKNEEQDFITYKVAKLSAKDPIKRAETINDIMKSILAISDNIKKNIFIKECSKILNIDEQVLLLEHDRLKNLGSNKNVYKEKISISLPLAKKTKIEDSIKILEKEIVLLLLRYGNKNLTDDLLFQSYIVKEIEDITFLDLYYDEIVKHYRGNIIQNVNYFHNDKLNLFDTELKIENIRNFVIDAVTVNDCISTNWEDKFGHYIVKETDNLKNSAYKVILKLKLAILKKMVKDNQEAMKLETDENSLNDLLSIHSYIKEEEKKISKKLGITAWG